ncbi:MAG: hypothetical protein ACNA8L_09955 [Luteolibacter sp.]
MAQPNPPALYLVVVSWSVVHVCGEAIVDFTLDVVEDDDGELFDVQAQRYFFVTLGNFWGFIKGIYE